MTEISKNNILSENELEQISGGSGIKKLINQTLIIAASIAVGMALIIINKDEIIKWCKDESQHQKNIEKYGNVVYIDEYGQGHSELNDF